MKIGIFGGTFNPIHNGHIVMAKQFIKIMQLDKLLIIPTNIPPHKIAKNLASPQQRFEMCKIISKKISSDSCNVAVSDIEIKIDRPSYTVFTVRELNMRYPQDELILLMGSDMFLTFKEWKNPDEILSVATLCGILRDDVSIERMKKQKVELEKMGGKIQLINMTPPTISSTMVRKKIIDNKPIDDFVDKDVCQYIKSNKLYAN